MPRTAPTTQHHLDQWFQQHGWNPFDFQRETWAAYLGGASGLVHAPTGMGKTLAVWGGPLIEALNSASPEEGLHVLWITPLRALANDTVESLLMPVREMGLSWTVEQRTGDTASSLRQRQKQRLPSALVTTPESLSLLLSHADSTKKFANLRCIIVDEWHELLGSKRGVQLELCLARLRKLSPTVRTWGLSATLANIDEAARVLTGDECAVIVRGESPKQVILETLIPETIENFPWGGHLGLRIVDQVLEKIEHAATTLVFTNTRSQSEQWFDAIHQHRPDWIGTIGIHHGSLDRDARTQVEDGLKGGTLRAAVCTSSLDLGVDFTPVEQVIQIGSPRGIARLLQRAGRSGHRPGVPSRIVCAPTNAFELIEFSAVRLGLERRMIEPRPPLRLCLDVLVQHLMTLAAAGGFTLEEAFQEVTSTNAYRDLSPEQFHWAIRFLQDGGSALATYPQYARIGESNGAYKATTADVIRTHRMSIGTITSDSSLRIKYRGGGVLGSAEEYFLSRLKPGERFLFAGRVLELLSIRNMTAEVRLAKGPPTTVPRWMGGRMPLSTLLADLVRERLDSAGDSSPPDAEMRAAQPILELQKSLSRLPRIGELLIEDIKTREGHHLFVYTFGGRLANEGLATLLAWRITRLRPQTITTTCNDYGIQLLSRKAFDISEESWREILSPDNLLEDLLACVNGVELARRRFRDIARVAGLVFQGYPGQQKSMRHVQASSGLLYDVFARFDPENPLLDQARREVLEEQLEYQRLHDLVSGISQGDITLISPERLTPLAFPLWVEQIRSHVSSEKWEERVKAMLAQLEKGNPAS